MLAVLCDWLLPFKGAQLELITANQVFIYSYVWTELINHCRYYCRWWAFTCTFWNIILVKIGNNLHLVDDGIFWVSTPHRDLCLTNLFVLCCRPKVPGTCCCLRTLALTVCQTSWSTSQCVRDSASTSCVWVSNQLAAVPTTHQLPVSCLNELCIC